MGRLIDLLLTTDPHQRIRLAQSALASLLMLACVLVLHYTHWAGLSDSRWLWTWTASSLTGLLVVFGLIRLGWTRRLSDPSLTVAQMLYAIACAAAGHIIAGSAHGAVVLMARADLQRFPVGVEVTYFLLTVIMVCGVVVLGGRLSAMHERLRAAARAAAAAAGGARTQLARRPPAVRGADRPRPLQAGERPARPCRGRRGAARPATVGGP